MASVKKKKVMEIIVKKRGSTIIKEIIGIKQKPIFK